MTTIFYDCIIPVSGGKDSTYQAYFMKEVYGMNPLCICFETTAPTDLGNQNLDNISKLGIDVIHFKKNYHVYKKMVVESFKRVGDEMWPNHLGIFTIQPSELVKISIVLMLAKYFNESAKYNFNKYYQNSIFLYVGLVLIIIPLY